jgi:hypothetical protein
MYTIDKQDKLAEITDLPESCSGAPLPTVVADEAGVTLVYFINEPHPDFDGRNPRSTAHAAKDDPIAIIRFTSPSAHYLGPPNDEALNGHPLYARGLRSYSVYEVLHSSWLRTLEQMNAVHPNHTPGLFSSRRHFIFTFHDSTFECVAEGYTCEITRGTVREVVSQLQK